jgi:hypothetical protein
VLRRDAKLLAVRLVAKSIGLGCVVVSWIDWRGELGVHADLTWVDLSLTY